MASEYKPELIQVGNRIIARREELGMSQTELAIQAGITQQTLSNIESGKRAVRIDTLVQIAEALKAPLSMLQPEYLDQYGNVENDMLSLMQGIKNLPLPQRKMMIRMFQSQIKSLESM